MKYGYKYFYLFLLNVLIMISAYAGIDGTGKSMDQVLWVIGEISEVDEEHVVVDEQQFDVKGAKVIIDGQTQTVDQLNVGDWVVLKQLLGEPLLINHNSAVEQVVQRLKAFVEQDQTEPAFLLDGQWLQKDRHTVIVNDKKADTITIEGVIKQGEVKIKRIILKESE